MKYKYSNLYMEKKLVGVPLKVEDYFLVNVRKVNKVKSGTIVGCILHHPHHSYIYKAFHVEFDDGSLDTIWAHNYKLVSNGYHSY